MNRRKFIQNLGRGTIFSALTLGSGYLLLREKPDNGEKCNFDFVCANCRKVQDCSLPEAKNYNKQN